MSIRQFQRLKVRWAAEGPREALHTICTAYDLPVALYGDGRMLRALGIGYIAARSPQAKGRIEGQVAPSKTRWGGRRPPAPSPDTLELAGAEGLLDEHLGVELLRHAAVVLQHGEGVHLGELHDAHVLVGLLHARTPEADVLHGGDDSGK